MSSSPGTGQDPANCRACPLDAEAGIILMGARLYSPAGTSMRVGPLDAYSTHIPATRRHSDSRNSDCGFSTLAFDARAAVMMGTGAIITGVGGGAIGCASMSALGESQCFKY